MNKSVMKCCICNNENIGQFITINNKKYHLCCIEQLQQENKKLLYYKKIIDKIIIVKDYPFKEDSNYILCNMSKQELYKLLCETRERIYKGR